MKNNRFKNFNKEELTELFSALDSNNEYLDNEAVWERRSKNIKGYFKKRYDINTSLLIELMEALKD